MSSAHRSSESPVRAVLGAVVLTVVAVVFANVVGAALLLGLLFLEVSMGTTRMLVYLLAAGQFGLLLFGVAYARRNDVAVPVELPTGTDLRFAVGGTVAALALAAAISYGLGVLDLLPGSVLEDQTAAEPAFLLALGALSIVVVAPAEELLFRGIIQDRLRETFGPAGAITGASLLFGALHVANYVGPPARVVSGVFLITVTGAVLGCVYEKTRNLAVPIAAHAAYNVVFSVVTYLRL
jgi:membrane protease YdiL (CAAX protease family)